MSQLFFYLLILLLPTQLGRHFWPKEAFIWGIKVDYLAPTVYLTDIVIFLIIFFWLIEKREIREKREKREIGEQKKDTSGVSQVGHLGSFKKILPYFLVFGFLVINCLLAKNQLVAFYKLIKIIEMGVAVIYVKEKMAYLNCHAEFISASKKGKILKQILEKVQNERIILLTLLAISVLYSSLIAFFQFLKQGSIGGLFWWLGERTFTAQTPGIAQINFAGRLYLRPYGTFPHPNVLAGFLALNLPVIFSVIANPPIWRVKQSRSRWGLLRQSLRVFLAMTIIFGTLALFLTFSRTAILAFLIGITLILLRLLKLKTHIFPKILSLIFLLSLVLGSWFLISRIKSPESITYRAELNKVAFKMIADYPIFGVGLNNFIVRLPDYGPPGMAVRFLQPVHNIYLLILAETGIVGLMLSLWLIIKIMKLRTKDLEQKKLFLVLGSWFIVIFLGFFDHYFLTLQQGQILLALVIGLGLRGMRGMGELREGKRA